MKAISNFFNIGLLPESGESAYQIAIAGGFVGTEQEWLASLKGQKGDDGDDGLSAYQIAIAGGFVGTEQEWLASLKGQKGDDGTFKGGDVKESVNFLEQFSCSKKIILNNSYNGGINLFGDDSRAPIFYGGYTGGVYKAHLEGVALQLFSYSSYLAPLFYGTYTGGEYKLFIGNHQLYPQNLSNVAIIPRFLVGPDTGLLEKNEVCISSNYPFSEGNDTFFLLPSGCTGIKFNNNGNSVLRVDRNTNDLLFNGKKVMLES